MQSSRPPDTVLQAGLVQSFTYEKQITMVAQHGAKLKIKVKSLSESSLSLASRTPDPFQSFYVSFSFSRCYRGQLLVPGPWYPCQWYSLWAGFLHRVHSVIWL